MRPFKPYSHGEEEPPSKRLTSCQKCFRTTFFSSRGRPTRCSRDWSSDVCSSDLGKDREGRPLGQYFIHGLGHHIGLNVHDPGDHCAPLQPGMVVTVEPGIYIPEENLGVRIEDDALITDSGYKLLSERLPRNPDEIERIMAEATKNAAHYGGSPAVKDSDSSDSDRTSQEIKSLIAKYAKSVSEADTNLASQIWWNSPEASFIHPLGHEHGFQQIKENVYQKLMGGRFSERNLSFHDVAVQVLGDA